MKVEKRKAFTLIIRWQSRKEISKENNRKNNFFLKQ